VTWELTATEQRILEYLPTYLRLAEIADRQHVSVNTVKSHIRGIYMKLGVSSRPEAVEEARRLGLLGEWVEPGRRLTLIPPDRR
jgi:LuxR family maltose regulon positive regulatory protein